MQKNKNYKKQLAKNKPKKSFYIVLTWLVLVTVCSLLGAIAFINTLTNNSKKVGAISASTGFVRGQSYVLNVNHVANSPSPNWHIACSDITDIVTTGSGNAVGIGNVPSYFVAGNSYVGVGVLNAATLDIFVWQDGTSNWLRYWPFNSASLYYNFSCYLTVSSLEFAEGVDIPQAYYDYFTVKLGTPVLTLYGYELSWNAVLGADYYTIYDGAGNVVDTVDATTYTLTETGSYYIKAFSLNQDYSSSDSSNAVHFDIDNVFTLATPENITVKNNIIYWDEVTNATYYKIYYGGELYDTVQGRTFYVTTINSNFTDSKFYQIQACTNDTLYYDSDLSINITVQYNVIYTSFSTPEFTGNFTQITIKPYDVPVGHAELGNVILYVYLNDIIYDTIPLWNYDNDNSPKYIEFIDGQTGQNGRKLQFIYTAQRSGEYSFRLGALSDWYGDSAMSNIVTVTDNASAYNTGYNDGYNKGASDGESIGYRKGLNAGERIGYDKGYLDGVDSASNYSFLTLITSVVDAPISMLFGNSTHNGFLNFNLFGVNVGAFITSLLTVLIAIWVVRKIKGG